MRPVLITLLSAAMLSAAGSPPAEPCATAERHELDFMIGNWLVRDPAGKAIGTATVARAYAGCVLIETWRDAGSGRASLGIIGFELESGTWRRDFLDSAGVVLSLAGRVEGTALAMSGNEYRAEGVRSHRVRWTSRAGGGIDQRWQISADGGRSWQLRQQGAFERISE